MAAPDTTLLDEVVNDDAQAQAQEAARTAASSRDDAPQAIQGAPARAMTGLDAFMNRELGGAGARKIDGRDNKGATFMRGPYRGMEVAQAQEAIRAKWEKMGPQQRQEFEAQAATRNQQRGIAANLEGVPSAGQSGGQMAARLEQPGATATAPGATAPTGGSMAMQPGAISGTGAKLDYSSTVGAAVGGAIDADAGRTGPQIGNVPGLPVEQESRIRRESGERMAAARERKRMGGMAAGSPGGRPIQGTSEQGTRVAARLQSTY